MKREGREHKLGAEETGVNRIFKASHSPTPAASATPSTPSARSHRPSSTQTIQSPGQRPKAGRTNKSSKCWIRAGRDSLR